MLQDLFDIHRRVTTNFAVEFVRSAYDTINWNNRLIGIIGARGTGKTTLVLQHYQKHYKQVEKCLYISADNPLVLKSGIYEIAAEYFKYYGDCLIIDEIHKQDNWSAELKALYDAYPDKKFIILGSSILNIIQSKGDLSRRMLTHRLTGLSFREYLNIRYETRFPIVSFSALKTDHLSIAEEIICKRKTILKDFEDYCRSGFYPFSINHTEDEYFQLLANVLDKVIYEDIPSLKLLHPSSSLKLKKLIAWLSAGTTPQISVSSLTNELDVVRDTLYDYLDLLERAQLIHIIRPINNDVRSYKRSKVLFATPNIYFSIQQHLWSSSMEKGNLRESFFISQASTCGRLHASAQADFIFEADGETTEIEIGGPSKGNRQIQGAENAIVLKDGIEIGFARQLPLYLAGFLH
jgi:predicted AAA+ superfamily ATPase